MISAIIPAFNEEQSIGRTIAALRQISGIDEIIVVDDGSSDRTAGAAAQAGAGQVIRLEKNRGKGHALAVGARQARGDILCFADADLGDTAGEFAKLLLPVLQAEADMTVARFPPPRRRAGMGLVKGLAGYGIYRLSGYRPNSPLSGQRVLRRCVWEAAAHAREGFGVEVGLTVGCLRAGFRLTEVPVRMSHRETGRDWHGLAHRGKQFLHVLRTLWRLKKKERVIR